MKSNRIEKRRIERVLYMQIIHNLTGEQLHMTITIKTPDRCSQMNYFTAVDCSTRNQIFC